MEKKQERCMRKIMLNELKCGEKGKEKRLETRRINNNNYHELCKNVKEIFLRTRFPYAGFHRS
jgi:hypothetical protein